MKELIAILPPEYRRRGLWVALSLLLRALLNLAGLAVLLPVLSLVLDPAAFAAGGRLAGIYARSGLASPHRFALAVCAAVALFVVLKCGANFLLARVERRYIYDLYHTLSRRLYVAYHDRGMAFVADSNSALLTRNVNVVCLAFVAGVLRPLASIAAEVLLLILIFTALLFYAPLAALLAAAVFLPAVWLYRVLVRNRIDRCGARENRAQREKTRLVAETFRGYADIELSNAFPSMLRTFDRVMDEVVRTRSHEADIGLLPQILTEIGLAAGMTLLAAWSFGDSRSGVLFGVFAVAAFRLMPSIRSILSSWSTIRFNRYTIAVLRDAPTQRQPEQQTPPRTDELLPFEREIAIRNLRFRYPRSRKELFGGLSLTVRKGERVGIRGVSGVGKTTLFNLLLGFYEPTEGKITVDGVALTPDNRRAWQNRIGYVSQRLFLTDGSFAANVAPGIPPHEIDRERVLEALEAACLGDFIAALPRGIDTPIGECGCRLSGGQRQRIGIARALYRRADVLFFDEATSALDSRTEKEVNRAIAAIAARNPGLTLLVIAHRESSLAHCDRTITLGK